MSVGIRTFESKKRRGLIHRALEVIQWDREVRKILEKGTGYRNKERDTTDSEESKGAKKFHNGQGRGRPTRAQATGGNKRGLRTGCGSYQPVAPLFVPRTQGGSWGAVADCGSVGTHPHPTP